MKQTTILAGFSVKMYTCMYKYIYIYYKYIYIYYTCCGVVVVDRKNSINTLKENRKNTGQRDCAFVYNDIQLY